MIIAIGGVCWSMVTFVVVVLCRCAAKADAAAEAAAPARTAEAAEATWRGVVLSLGDPASQVQIAQAELTAQTQAVHSH